MTKNVSWEKKYPNGKAVLSWDLSDYLYWKDEPPQCILGGITEGMSFDETETEQWAREELQTLCILKEMYPKKFDEHFQNFVLDLEYLHSLGKISKEDLKTLSDKENIDFGYQTKK